MAVQNRAALKSDKDTAFADNSSGDISAADLRGELEDILDSVYIAGDDNTADTQLMTAAEKTKLSGVATGATANPNALDNVSEDTSPQLGGNLDVNGSSIVSVSNGNITLAPNGTGNIVLGNFTLDADATVGAGQDNYVLTYDHGTGTWGAEAAPGAGGGDAWSDPVNSNITFDTDSTYDIGSVSAAASAIYTDSLVLGGTTLTGGGIADPGVDSFLMWDESANDAAFFSLGTGLSATGTTVNAEVSLAGTQTLTNKTLTAPVLTSPEVSYTSDNDGTQSSGTYTPAVSGSNIKRIVNGGAFTLGVPSGEGTFVVQVTNNASAGTITTSNYTAVKGDTLTTTDGDDFMLYITVVNSFSVLNVVALQ